MTVLFETVPSVRSASLGVWLRMGSRHEQDAVSGICHFIEHLVFKGTESRTAREINLLSDRIGGNLDAFTSKETTCFYSRVLDEHLPIAIDLLADIVLNPQFDGDELERERRVILEEIRMVSDSPEDRTYDLFFETFWPNHPLGRPIQGTEQTVGGMSRDTVIDWFRAAYNPANIVVSIAGAVDDASRERIRRAFEVLPKGSEATTDGPPTFEPGVVSENRSELEQVQLMLGVPGLPSGHPSRYALLMLHTILGGSMSSRLFQTIREEHGLAYSIGSQIHTFSDAGLMTVYVGTSPENVSQAIELSLQSLRDLAATAPSQDEVDVARDHLKGNMLLALESTSSRMTRAAREEMVLGRHVSEDEIVRELDAVTPETIRAMAESLFSSQKVGVCAVGPMEKVALPSEVTL